MSLGAAADPVV